MDEIISKFAGCSIEEADNELSELCNKVDKMSLTAKYNILETDIVSVCNKLGKLCIEKKCSKKTIQTLANTMINIVRRGRCIEDISKNHCFKWVC